jgi:hypothetical protein
MTATAASRVNTIYWRTEQKADHRDILWNHPQALCANQRTITLQQEYTFDIKLYCNFIKVAITTITWYILPANKNVYPPAFVYAFVHILNDLVHSFSRLGIKHFLTS